METINSTGAGETISAEDIDYCLRRLNLIVDSMGASKANLFKDQLVSGVVTGATLTIGAGSFATVSAGGEIQGMLADNYTMSPISFEQYRDIFDKNEQGRPVNYAYDGYDKIYLYPAATGNTMTIQCRQDIQQFANLDTDYLFPDGYFSAFVYWLADDISTAFGATNPQITRKKMEAMRAITADNLRPLILHDKTYSMDYTSGNILNGFN